jgi:HEAT repeat protein
LEELIDMLGDNDLSIRGRAAATLSRLAEADPKNLLDAIPRLREHMDDDSDYVRWHLVYAFGEISVRVSTPTREYWGDVFTGMTDDSHIVRAIAGKAAARLAEKHPDAVAAFFREMQRQVPPELAKYLPAEATVGD